MQKRWSSLIRAVFSGVAVSALLFGCAGNVQPTTPETTGTVSVPVQVKETALAQPTACEGRFVEHRLEVSNGTRIRDIFTYTSNGSGVAVNDLDGDGDLDLVFAIVDRESEILWNQGGLDFKAETLPDRFTRAVVIVDVDGDGRLDLTFTHRGLEGVTYWRNLGGGRFTQQTLDGVTHYSYALAWADLAGDSHLDLVTAAYDVDLRGAKVPDEEIAARGGVMVYEQSAGTFIGQQLHQKAETLAIALVDINGDGYTDIWAANDFAVPDSIFLRDGETWKESEPFRQTSYSSMSIDWGDLTNQGRVSLFTTDMNPATVSPSVLAAWLPVIAKLEEKKDPNDPQIMANTLQIQTSTGRWRNEAARRGVDATGWSWSGKMGDLDNDGYLDLYILTGMIAENLFGHLPNAELVEENQAFRNQGDGSFLPAPEWGLGSTYSGRSMAVADYDLDGDLDIVVNNLRQAAQLYENRICSGKALEVDLRWLDSRNSHVLGAQIDLHTSQGVLRRDVRAASGYLSGDPARVHFGFLEGTTLEKLVIRYPDGATAQIDSLHPHTLLEVTR